VSNRAFNLLTKNNVRAALADEIEEGGPEVALVVGAFAFTGDRERLARTGTVPDRAVGGPTGKLEGEIPPSDPCEETNAGKFFNVVGGYIINTSVVDFSGHYQPLIH
jgi:hypothetical protein